MDPGSPSQLVGCPRTLLRQLSVQAEAISEVDGQEIESAQAGLEQPTHERSGLLVQVILTPHGGFGSHCLPPSGRHVRGGSLLGQHEQIPPV